jgi:predicted butyrate kinase (DUF1464 family)
MPRVLGIDPGTFTFDICGLEDGGVFLRASIPTSDFARHPEVLLASIEKALPLDLIAGPSGYGLPLLPIESVGEPELRLLCLAKAGEDSRIGGLRTLVRLLREARLPVVFTPGVLHLPTVPPYRKVNRVDIGTADKVCVAALAIENQRRHLGVPYGETGMVLVELGGAFTAVLALEDGCIVSGQGGSSGPIGYLSGGAMDGEVAFLLGGATKNTVFSGGAAFVGGDPGAAPETLAGRQDENARRAKDAFVEGVLKAVAAELAIVPHAREILLSGRLSRIPGFREPVAAALSRLAPVRDLAEDADAKEAALGAALIADGLAGGRFRPLVDALRLREAAGTVLDHLYLDGVDTVRTWVLSES